MIGILNLVLSYVWFGILFLYMGVRFGKQKEIKYCEWIVAIVMFAFSITVVIKEFVV